jgi:hypothetical protein
MRCRRSEADEIDTTPPTATTYECRQPRPYGLPHGFQKIRSPPPGNATGAAASLRRLAAPRTSV